MYLKDNGIKLSHHISPDLLKKEIGYVAAKEDYILSLQGVVMVMGKELMNQMIKEQWPNHSCYHAKIVSLGEIIDCLEGGSMCFVDTQTQKNLKLQLNKLGLSHHLSNQGKTAQISGKKVKIYPFSSQYIFLPESNSAEKKIDDRIKVDMPYESFGELYEQNFLKAIKRTTKLGFPAISFEKKDGKVLSEIMPLLKSKARHCELEEVAFKCNIISQQIVDLIQEETGRKAFLTIGTIWKNGKDLFSSANCFDEKFIQKIIKTGKVPVNYSHHAWVTLDTMEIIDFTLDASKRLVSGCQNDSGYLITAEHHKDIVDKLYVPVLIGKTFYEKYDAQRYRLAQATLRPLFV